MSAGPSPTMVVRYRRASGALALGATAIGVVVLLGWMLGLPRLTDWFPSAPEAKFNAGACLVLCGLSLWLQRAGPPAPKVKAAAWALAGVATLLAFLTAIEYLLGWDLGIDQLVVREPLGGLGALAPGRMAPVAAGMVLLLGPALLLLDVHTRRGRWPANALTALALLGTLFSVCGYVFGVAYFQNTGPGRFLWAAVPMTLGLVLLSLGLLAARTEHGLMARFASDGLGGKLARFLVPVTVLVPLGLAALLNRFMSAEILHQDFGLAVFTAATIAASVALVLATGRHIDRLEAERTATTAELAVSERRFFDALDNVQLVAVQLDPAGRVLYSNDYLLRLTGYRRDEILGTDWFDRFVPDAADVRAIFVASFASGSIPPHYENTIRTRSGQERLIAWNNTVTRGVSGAVVGTLSIGEDITERRAAEEAQGENARRLAAIVEAVPFGAHLYELMPDGRLVFQGANPAAERILKLDHRPLVGRTLEEAFPGNTGHPRADGYRRVAAGGGSWDEEQAVYDDGKIAGAFEVHAVQTLPNRVAIFFADITERANAERERRLLSDTIGSSINEVYLFDAETMRFRFVNDGALRNLGYTAEQIRGMTPLDLKPAFTLESFQALVAPLRRREIPMQVFETFHRRADGSDYPVEVHLQLMEHDRSGVFLAVIQDITERKRADAALRESEAQFRAQYRNHPQPTYTWRKEGDDFRLVDLNDAATAIADGSPTNLVGRMASDLYARRPDVRRALERCVGGGVVLREELRSEHFLPGRQVIATYAFVPPDLVMVYLDDITERKHAEEALRQTSELLSLFVLHSPVYAYIKDVTATESRVVTASENFKDMVGIPGSEMAGKTMEELFPAEFAARISADDWAVVSRGEVLRLDEDLNGRHYTTIKFPIVLGGRTLLAGYTIDITERKEAEEAIRASEMRYRSLFESMTEGFAHCRMRFEDGEPVDFIYLDVNAAFEAQTGLKDVVGRWVSEVIPGIRQADPELFARYGRVARTGTPERFEIYVSALEAWFDISVYCPQPEHFVAVFDVITARKETEKALRESEGKYRSLVDGLPIGIYRSSADGRLLAVNRAWLDLMGYESEAEALQLRMARDVYEDPTFPARAMDQVSGKPDESVIETRWKRRDGTPIDVRITTRPVRDEDGTTSAFESAVEDVTGRRALEEQLHQTQKIEAVGQLAGGVAHDFNNLLTTIVTSVDLLSDLGPAGSEAAEDLAAIKHAAERGAELTSKLLAFGRKQRLELRTADLNALTRDFTKLAKRLVREDIGIVTRLESGALPVRVDPTAVDQILMNLTTNARDAMPGGGVLVILTGRMTIDEEFCATQGWGAPGAYAVLSVSDTARGWTPRRSAACSSRSSPPSRSVRAPGWGRR